VQAIPDWLLLWQELVEAQVRGRVEANVGLNPYAWRDKAQEFQKAVKERWQKPDSSRDLIAADLEQHPGETVLDIGAGIGAWTVFMAPHARHITALDPSLAMLEILRDNISAAGLSNVTVIEGYWPETDVAPHDVVLCSHALYGITDFATFVRKMEATARRRCYMLLRIVTPDGVMAEAAQHIWGQPYDSPNFQVAYNALLQLGIFANVQIEDTGLWKPWTHTSLDEALADLKLRFDLLNDATHDAFLRDLLARRLTKVDGQWVWPRGARSALVYWDVGKIHNE